MSRGLHATAGCGQRRFASSPHPSRASLELEQLHDRARVRTLPGGRGATSSCGADVARRRAAVARMRRSWTVVPVLVALLSQLSERPPPSTPCCPILRPPPPPSPWSTWWMTRATCDAAYDDDVGAVTAMRTVTATRTGTRRVVRCYQRRCAARGGGVRCTGRPPLPLQPPSTPPSEADGSTTSSRHSESHPFDQDVHHVESGQMLHLHGQALGLPCQCMPGAASSSPASPAAPGAGTGSVLCLRGSCPRQLRRPLPAAATRLHLQVPGLRVQRCASPSASEISWQAAHARSRFGAGQAAGRRWCGGWTARSRADWVEDHILETLDYDSHEDTHERAGRSSRAARCTRTTCCCSRCS